VRKNQGWAAYRHALGPMRPHLLLGPRYRGNRLLLSE
jgi:hypothetical protein